MTDKQRTALIENMSLMLDAMLDKSQEYRMIERGEFGERITTYNREEFLEFTMNSVFESLADTFPELEEEVHKHGGELNERTT